MSKTMQTDNNIKLALGPIQYFWPRETVMDFYHDMIETPVDIIYLGETVCAKRRQLSFGDWFDLASKLTASGKQVVLSTLTLIEAESELNAMKKICHNGNFLVEANDMAAVELLSREQLPFVAGPFINVYNSHSLALLAKQGMTRWVMPVELSKATLSQIIQASSDEVRQQVEVEVFSYGRMPLAYSARCFTARAYDLPKDDCRFICAQHDEGLPMQSQEGQTVFNINGIQTQSGEVYNLLPQIPAMKKIGVDIMRLSPQPRGMAEVIQEFDQARRSMQELPKNQVGCNGYWFQRAGMENCYVKEKRL